VLAEKRVTLLEKKEDRLGERVLQLSLEKDQLTNSGRLSMIYLCNCIDVLYLYMSSAPMRCTQGLSNVGCISGARERALALLVLNPRRQSQT
jgi:hypothetical protein